MNNELIIKSQQGIVDYANEYIKQNNIIVSKNYDLGKAMNSLYLNLLQVKDKNGKQALEVCSDISIREAVMECVNRELNVSRSQGYFIPYGDKLQFQPSYFGLSKMARDLANVNIITNVIREDEQAELESRIDGSLIVHHKPNIKSLNKKIIAVYAVATDINTGRVINSDIMSIEEVKKSLAKSRTGGTVAKEFENQMARKVVERRLAKHFVNKADDSMIITVTDVDGKTTRINEYDDLLDDDFDYTINTDEQIAHEKETYIPSENSVITSEDLKLDKISAPKVGSVEGAFEISYAEYKNNTDIYDLVPNSWNPATKTVFVKNK